MIGDEEDSIFLPRMQVLESELRLLCVNKNAFQKKKKMIIFIPEAGLSHSENDQFQAVPVGFVCAVGCLHLCSSSC